MNPFDYCAMFYADTWLERDHRFCERLPNPAAQSRLQLLAEALRFYRVARCWRKRHKDDDETRFQPLLDIMDNIAATAVRPLNRTELVEAVIIQLEPYIGCEPFSLTTKTLWLWFKQPFIIYDGNASNALGFRNRLSHRDAAAYYQRWETAFARATQEILDACSRLPAQRSWLKHGQQITDSELQQLAFEQFFRERVFDEFLWSCAKREIRNRY